jgi:hypothetical protein
MREDAAPQELPAEWTAALHWLHSRVGQDLTVLATIVGTTPMVVVTGELARVHEDGPRFVLTFEPAGAVGVVPGELARIVVSRHRLVLVHRARFVVAIRARNVQDIRAEMRKAMKGAKR